MWNYLFALAMLACSTQIMANTCKSIDFGIVDWTDVRVTTAVAEVILERLGYDVSVSEHTVDGIYNQLSKGDIDIFLGNWMPTMAPIITPYVDNKSVESLTVNLQNARYTLAVPSYVYNAGVKSFSDLAQFRDKFDGRIYGLEKGNDGNQLIDGMIKGNEFNLGQFKLLETSERLMLAQVNKKLKKNEWIVFLAWEPHPMNTQYDISYLSGGDDYFGPDFGGSNVHTNIRSGFSSMCPNAVQFLRNLKFDVEMEGEIMNEVMNGFVPADRAVRDWMFKNPDRLEQWLDGVKRVNGTPVDPAKLARSFELTFDS